MKQSSFNIFMYFIRSYPLRSAAVLGALFVAGLIETIGISALLPLFNVIIETNNVSNADPNILTKAINALFETLKIEQSFSNLLIIITATICLKAFIVFHALRVVAFASTDITRDLRTQLIQGLIKAKWTYYSTLPSGQSATAIATEAEQAGQFFMLSGRAIAALVQASLYSLIAVLVDWKVSLLAIGIGCIGAYCLKFLLGNAKKYGIQLADKLQSLMIRLNESLMGAKPLKAMGEEDRFIRLLEKDINDVNHAKKRQLVSNLLLQGFQEPLLIILISFGLFWAYTYAEYPVTELLLIAFLFYRLISQMNMVQNNYQKSINFEGSVRAILKSIHSAEDNSEINKGTKKPTFTKGIFYQDLTLSYDKNIIIEKLTDHIPVNKLSVIFGPSGVGKSTLLDATLGLLNPKEGQVTIDNTCLSKIDVKKWRQKIGYVPQETFLFHDTILQNITLGDETISEDQAIKALKTANAWEFINETQDGIYHIVGERGGKLSGGQKQRLALARAIIRNPDLLILDEATTGLDKESENKILQSLDKMLKDTTIIAISHDPKILDIADHVIRLDK